MAWNAATQRFPSTRWVRYRPRPWDIQHKIRAYLADRPLRPDNSKYLQAVKLAREAFRVPRVKPFHINDAIRHFQHPDRSPGLPYTKLGYRKKSELDPLIIKQYIHNLKYGIYSKCTTPCNGVGKSMVGRQKKFRLIWVYPAHMTYAEAMFAQPLINAYIRKRGAYALWVNYSHGDLRMLRSHGSNWLGLDWDAYDSTVPAWLIRDAFDILKDQIDWSGYEYWGKPTNSNTLPHLWNRIIKYFIDTPIKDPNGKVTVKHHGIPSGSYFTNLVGSVCNYIVVAYLLGDSLQTSATWVCGDDCLALVVGKIDISVLAGLAISVFGMSLNVDKSELGPYVSFLGYRMHPDGRPRARFDKLLAQLLLPSMPDRSITDFCYRARALQLSCFGFGCLSFTYMAQEFLDGLRVDLTSPHFHKSDDVWRKLEALNLTHWPPLSRVMLSV